MARFDTLYRMSNDKPDKPIVYLTCFAFKSPCFLLLLFVGCCCGGRGKNTFDEKNVPGRLMKKRREKGRL